MNEEKRRLLEDRAAKLSSLKQHPNWAELLAEFDRRRARNGKRYFACLQEGDAAGAQREFDRAQGFDAALVWVRGVVEQAEATLEKTLREAKQQEGDE